MGNGRPSLPRHCPGSGHAGFGLAQDDSDAVPGFVEAVVQRLGKVDVLVNNAYGGGAPSIDTASAEDFNRPITPA